MRNMRARIRHIHTGPTTAASAVAAEYSNDEILTTTTKTPPISTRLLVDEDHASWVMTLMDLTMIQFLRKEFQQQYTQGLDQDQFIQLVCQGLGLTKDLSSVDHHTQRIRALFRAMDMTDSGVLRWEDVTNYIVGSSSSSLGGNLEDQLEKGTTSSGASIECGSYQRSPVIHPVKSATSFDQLVRT